MAGHARSSFPGSCRRRSAVRLLLWPAAVLAVLAVLWLHPGLGVAAAVSPSFSQAFLGTGVTPGVVSGDFNGDGAADLVVATYGGVGKPGVLRFLAGDGRGGFAAPVDTQLPFVGVNRVAAADFSRDGKLDVAMGINDRAFAVLLGNGDGTFRAPNLLPTDGYSAKPLPCELNGDGKLDLVGVSEESYWGIFKVPVFTGAGVGGFNVVTYLDTLRGPLSVGAADLDGDKDCDLAVGTWGNPDTGVFMGAVSVFLNNGAGVFTPGSTVFLAKDPLGLAPADMNRDGKTDLVVASSNSDPSDSHGLVSVLLGNGTGAFPALSQKGPFDMKGASPTDVQIADFDRDGKLDVCATARDGTWLSVFSGRADGTLDPDNAVPTSRGASQATVADFNKDGKPDIAVAYASAGPGTRVFLNTTPTRDVTRPVTFAPSACTVRRGQTAKLRYKVTDAFDKTVRVTIRITSLKGKLLKKIGPFSAATGVVQSKGFRCTLPKGRYRFLIHAIDAAGNPQSSVGKNTLIVR